MSGDAVGRGSGPARVLRSPWVRWAFLAVAVGLAVFAVVRSRDGLVEAARNLDLATVAGALALSVAFVGCTFFAWRTVLADLGSPLPLRQSLSVFGLSQVGKYVPGGVWNVVAAAEIGAGHRIPRRRSVAAMAVAVLVSVVSGAVLAFATVPFLTSSGPGGTPQADAVPWGHLLWVLPVGAVALLPPVVNRLVGLALRAGHREPLEHPLGWRGVGAAVLWALAGWAFAGAQVWLLATGLGMAPTVRQLVLSVGGFALAWVVGFVVVVVPAGAGAREAVLLAVLGGALPHAAVLLVVLVSRVLVTVVDLALAGAGALLARPHARA